MLHALKLTQPYFDDVAAGNKSFEVRKADRPYAVGDYIALNEWDGDYTGRFMVAKIVYVLSDTEYVKDGYVTLGLVPAEIFSENQLYGFDLTKNRPTKGYQIYGKHRIETLRKPIYNEIPEETKKICPECAYLLEQDKDCAYCGQKIDWR